MLSSCKSAYAPTVDIVGNFLDAHKSMKLLAAEICSKIHSSGRVLIKTMSVDRLKEFHGNEKTLPYVTNAMEPFIREEI